MDSLDECISGLMLANQLKSTQLKDALLAEDGDGKALIRHWNHKSTVSTLEAFQEILAGCPYNSSERFISFSYRGTAWSYTRSSASTPWRPVADKNAAAALRTTDPLTSFTNQATPRFRSPYSRNPHGLWQMSPKFIRGRPSLHSFVHESTNSSNYTIVPIQHITAHPSPWKRRRERAVFQRVFDKVFSGRSAGAAPMGRNPAI